MAGLVVAIVFLLPVPRMLHAPATSMEEGALLEYPVLVLHGEVPTRDFSSFDGPYTEWVPALADALGGPSVLVERSVGLAYRALLLVAVYALARRWGRAAAVIAVLLCWAILAPFGAIAYSWVGGLAFSTAGLACMARINETREIGRRRSRWILAGGFLMGSGLGFRPDLVLAVALSCLVILPGGGRRRAGEWLVGLAAGLAPYLALVALAGPLAVLRNLFWDPVVRLRPARTLPVPPSTSRISDFFSSVQAFVVGSHRWPGLALPAQLSALFWALVAILVVMIVAGVRRRLAGGPRETRLLAVAVFAAGLAPAMLQRLDITHMRLVGCLWVAFLPVAVVDLVRRGNRLARGRTFVAVGAGAAAGLAGVSSFYVAQAAAGAFLGISVHGQPSLPVASVTNTGRVLPIGPPAAAEQVRALVGLVDREAKAGERLFVGPSDLRLTNYSDTWLYYLLPQLRPASYYLEMNPGVANRPGSRLATDIASADWIVLSSVWTGWTEPNASTRPGSPDANLAVRRDFCPVARIGPYLLARHVVALAGTGSRCQPPSRGHPARSIGPLEAAGPLDTFAGPDDPYSLGRGPAGTSWRAVGGRWGIVGGHAYVAVPGPGRNLAVTGPDGGVATVQVRLDRVAQGAGLVFRYRDQRDYWYVAAVPSYATWAVVKVVNGVQETVANTGLSPVKNGTTVAVGMQGDTIVVSLDGRVGTRVTDTAPYSAGLVGMTVEGAGAGSARFSDFRVGLRLGSQGS